MSHTKCAVTPQTATLSCCKGLHCCGCCCLLRLHLSRQRVHLGQHRGQASKLGPEALTERISSSPGSHASGGACSRRARMCRLHFLVMLFLLLLLLLLLLLKLLLSRSFSSMIRRPLRSLPVASGPALLLLLPLVPEQLQLLALTRRPCLLWRWRGCRVLLLLPWLLLLLLGMLLGGALPTAGATWLLRWCRAPCATAPAAATSGGVSVTCTTGRW